MSHNEHQTECENISSSSSIWYLYLHLLYIYRIKTYSVKLDVFTIDTSHCEDAYFVEFYLFM